MTDVAASTFPAWFLPVVKALLGLVAISEEQSGQAHVAVLVSDNVARIQGSGKAVFFNHFLEGRQTHHFAYDQALGAWVWNFLEETTRRTLATNPTS